MKIKKILSILSIPLAWMLIFLVGYVYSASEHIPPHFHANFAMYVNGVTITSSPKPIPAADKAVVTAVEPLETMWACFAPV